MTNGKNKDEKTDPGKSAVTMYLDNDVIAALNTKSRDVERSRSWFANFVLRPPLGLLEKQNGMKK